MKRVRTIKSFDHYVISKAKQVKLKAGNCCPVPPDDPPNVTAVAQYIGAKIGKTG